MGDPSAPQQVTDEVTPVPSVELSVPNPVWTFSTYELLDGDRVHVEHPNRLGTTTETGQVVESRRFRRFREEYISREMRDILIGRQRVLSVLRLRRNAAPEMIARCKEKTCFRRDDVTTGDIPSPSRETPSVHFGNEVPALVERSRAALEAATEYYGPDVMSDMRLGFSRPFDLDDEIPDLPLVADVVGSLDDAAHHDTISLLVSYRHTTKKEGYILNVEPDAWRSLLSTVQVLCRRAGCNKFRLWTDQMLSFRKPQATLRWVSSGVLPYTVYPIVYIIRPALHDDLNRMWISIEHLAANFGQGLIHAGESLTGDVLPKEWVTTYVDITEGSIRLTWVTGIGMEMYQVVRKLCGLIMCGLLRNKALSWPLDAQDIIEWASTIVSTLSSKDIGHTFTCGDCKSPAGYTSRCRMAGLLSSCASVYPSIPDALPNEAHPRPNVPAVRLSINGVSWDGFREWVPESCLWGASQDQLKHSRRAVLDKTKAVVVSDGGPRAVGVLQYELQKGVGLLVGYLLVGLVGESRSRHQAKAVWSKRFWPVDPVRMWLEFRKLHRNTRDGEALSAVAVMVGAASGLDYTSLSDAQEVSRVNVANVKW